MPELMVALLVFATLSAGGVYVLRLSVDAREQLGATDRYLSEIEIARTILREDFAQIALRPVRDEFGAAKGPAFRGGEFLKQESARDDEQIILAFVRRGWLNPEWKAPRSSMQYVEYVVADDALIRRARPYLDDARDQPFTDRVIFGDVDGARFSFLVGEFSGRLDWSPVWPAAGDINTAPKAVELVFETGRYGELRQLFWIGDIAPTGGADA